MKLLAKHSKPEVPINLPLDYYRAVVLSASNDMRKIFCGNLECKCSVYEISRSHIFTPVKNAGRQDP